MANKPPQNILTHEASPKGSSNREYFTHFTYDPNKCFPDEFLNWTTTFKSLLIWYHVYLVKDATI